MSVIVYAANAGDRNVHGMLGASRLGERIAEKLCIEPLVVGSAAPLIGGNWTSQLENARPNLRLLAGALEAALEAGHKPILTMGRCAAGLAILPIIAQRHPDAAIVYFDAHGDCNAPGDGREDDAVYLGGMVITGAAGIWDTGFGGTVKLHNVILVGSRDLDPAEVQLIDAGELQLVRAGPGLDRRLSMAIGGRPSYIHLDCDVLNAGLLATEYQSPNGLSFDDLGGALRLLAEHPVLGIEIAEFEDCWPDTTPNDHNSLIGALAPVLEVLRPLGILR